jgi:ATP-dependent Clp protease ATP-binding subunit ClpC
MKENYTKGIQKILKYAKEESIRLGQTYVGSEHILLGVLKDKNGNAASTLIIMGCDLNKIKQLIESLTTKTDNPSNTKLSKSLNKSATDNIQMYICGPVY